MKTRIRLVNTPWVAAAVAVAALALAATPARSQVILGGDFQLYKPGTTTVTATITSGYVPWPASIPNPTDPTSLTVRLFAKSCFRYPDWTMMRR